MEGFSFDYYSRYEFADIYVATPAKNIVGVIRSAVYKDLKLTLRFTTHSEVSFTVYEKYKSQDKIEASPYYKHFKKNNLIYLNNIGWFIIFSSVETKEGKMCVKNINCLSYEKTLMSRKINLLNGTYKFYDELNPANSETMLGLMQLNAPNWKIGHVDSSLWGKYRTFDVPSTNVHAFLTEDIVKAYNCMVTFDTENQLINFYAPENYVKETDIIFTFDNLLKKTELEEASDNIITALGVHGSGDLDIRNVNPLGTSFIYNFEHYYDDMSPELVTAIEEWQKKISIEQETYSKLLISLKEQNAALLVLKGQLSKVKGELDGIDKVRTTQMPNVLAETTNQYNAKNAEYNAKQNEITAKAKEIEEIAKQMDIIHEKLLLKSNFSQEQLTELECFIFEGTYTNENFIKTDKMTPVDIQEMSMQLLEDGKAKLNLVSKPILQLTIDAANFLFLKQFQIFKDQLELGCIIHIQNKEGVWYQPALLEMTIDYDNPDNFTMVFSNRFKLTTDIWTLADLINDFSKTETNVLSNSSTWGQVPKSGIIDEVKIYMNNALNLAHQEIINSSDMEVSFGEYGLRTRKKLVSGDEGFDPNEVKYHPVQVWIYNKGMAFTDNNWQSAKAFLGQIGDKFGLIADVLVGQIVAGRQLTITNENMTFVVDDKGVKIENANIEMTSGKNKIHLNPLDGIRVNDGIKDVFYFDANTGKLCLEGEIKAISGNIGGFNIRNTGIYNTSNGDYIGSDGSGKLSLFTWTPNTARFEGYVYTDNLIVKNNPLQTHHYGNGSVTANKLDTVYATKVYADQINADKASINQLNTSIANIGNLYVRKDGTFSGTISWNGGSSGVRPIGNLGYTELYGDGLFINSTQNIRIDAIGKTIQMNGNLQVYGQIRGNFKPSGGKTVTFKTGDGRTAMYEDGILTNIK